jgi:anti-sigma factor RsiW
MNKKWSDLALMRYADGEMSAKEVTEVEDALKHSKRLNKRLRVFTRTRRAVQELWCWHLWSSADQGRKTIH